MNPASERQYRFLAAATDSSVRRTRPTATQRGHAQNLLGLGLERSSSSAQPGSLKVECRAASAPRRRSQRVPRPLADRVARHREEIEVKRVGFALAGCQALFERCDGLGILASTVQAAPSVLK